MGTGLKKFCWQVTGLDVGVGPGHKAAIDAGENGSSRFRRIEYHLVQQRPGVESAGYFSPGVLVLIVVLLQADARRPCRGEVGWIQRVEAPVAQQVRVANIDRCAPGLCYPVVGVQQDVAFRAWFTASRGRNWCWGR